MKQFSKSVDMRSRRAMTEYLTGHFRYSTMNSWNQSTSYANNVKVYNLGLTKEQEDKLYAMLETSEFYTYINDLLNDIVPYCNSVRNRKIKNSIATRSLFPIAVLSLK